MGQVRGLCYIFVCSYSALQFTMIGNKIISAKM